MVATLEKIEETEIPKPRRRFRTKKAGMFKATLGVNENKLPVAIEFIRFFEDGNYINSKYGYLEVSEDAKIGNVYGRDGKKKKISGSSVIDVIKSLPEFHSGVIYEDKDFYIAEQNKNADLELQIKLKKLAEIDEKIAKLEKSTSKLESNGNGKEQKE